jgi:hypothetical protein
MKPSLHPKGHIMNLHTDLLQIAEAMDATQKMIQIADMIEHTPSEFVSTQMWEDLRECMPLMKVVLSTFEQSLAFGVKITSNEALAAHLNAVATSM